MNESHMCQWRTQKSWELIDDNKLNWIAQAQYRYRICAICGQQIGKKPTGMVKRWRTRLDEKPVIPDWIRKIPAKGRTADELVAILKINRLEVEKIILDWLDKGYICLQEERLPQNKYRMERVWLTDQAQNLLIDTPRIAKKSEESQAFDDLLMLFDGWETDLANAIDYYAHDPELLGIAHQLGTVLYEQQSALKKCKWLSLPNLTHRLGGGLHRRWIASLRGILNLMSTLNWEYERTFSSRWLKDSKLFTKERRELEKYLKLEEGFEQIGLVRHTPIVYCWGSWQGSCKGHLINGQAGVPFIALSALTIQSLEDIIIDANKLLIIENQTAFEAILRHQSRADIVYLFGSGFSGYAERELIRLFFSAKPSLKWFIWTDYDIGGIRILQFWEDWSRQNGISLPIPYLWQQHYLEKWSQLGKKLSEKELDILSQMKNPLARILLDLGKKIEQENLIKEVVTYVNESL